MKRFSNLYENIYKPENIKACYREVMRNTKNKRQVYKLQNNADNVIRTIYEELKNEKYVVGKYNVFIIYEPKQRKIVSQGMKDKIINHLIAREILYPAILPCLVPFNVASRPGMGTKKALEYLERYRKQFAAKNKKYFMLKCDNHFFRFPHFSSINRLCLSIRLLILSLGSLKNVESMPYSWVNTHLQYFWACIVSTPLSAITLANDATFLSKNFSKRTALLSFLL